MDEPVFIMTCVVARFTFFLNPMATVHQHEHSRQPLHSWESGTAVIIPAHDMLGER